MLFQLIDGKSNTICVVTYEIPHFIQLCSNVMHLYLRNYVNQDIMKFS